MTAPAFVHANHCAVNTTAVSTLCTCGVIDRYQGDPTREPAAANRMVDEARGLLSDARTPEERRAARAEADRARLAWDMMKERCD